MDKSIKMGILSGIVGAVLGLGALSLSERLIDAGKRTIGMGPGLEVTTHICSSNQLPNLSETFNDWLKEKAITDQGYTEIRTRGDFTYSRFDIYTGSSKIAHDFNSMDSPPLFMPKFKGIHDFLVHVDDFGHHQTFKPEVNFLDNKTLLKEIFNHARKHKDKLYDFCEFAPEDHERKGVPIKYSISIGGVNYKVDNLSILTEGNSNDFRQAWMNQVVYK
jgi:hypothetical protein